MTDGPQEQCGGIAITDGSNAAPIKIRAYCRFIFADSVISLDQVYMTMPHELDGQLVFDCKWIVDCVRAKRVLGVSKKYLKRWSQASIAIKHTNDSDSFNDNADLLDQSDEETCSPKQVKVRKAVPWSWIKHQVVLMKLVAVTEFTPNRHGCRVYRI